MKLINSWLVLLVGFFATTVWSDNTGYSTEFKNCSTAGWFQCGNLTQCVPQKQNCDGVVNCKNGFDEDNKNCKDRHGSLETIAHQRNQSINRDHYANCSLEQYPAEICTCRNWTWLICISAGFKRIPANLSINITRLILAHNSISKITRSELTPYHKLQLLYLENNDIYNIEPGLFQDLKNLEKLFLQSNKIQDLKNETFTGLDNLHWLFLYNNRLGSIKNGTFYGLENIKWINLKSNRMKEINLYGVFSDTPNINHIELRQNELVLRDQVFPLLKNVTWIELQHNLIEEINNKIFENLPELDVLDLGNNRITHIKEYAFYNNRKLKELILSNNKLQTLPERIFSQLGKLTKLDISGNPILTLPIRVFAPLYNLKSLSMAGMDMPYISTAYFSNLKNAEFVYFGHFSYCKYVPHVRTCKPNTDGVSSVEQLLVNPVLRSSVWIVALLTTFGNAIVLCGRLLSREENKMLSMFIRNLSAADCLMGIYLFLIGIHDLLYRDRYNMHAMEWMASWRCVISGVLAMTSSETSVLILAFMSLERFLCIASPFGGDQISHRSATIALVVIWITGLTTSVIPFVLWSEPNQFYGSNGVCFPLHIADPYSTGWQYSAFVFLGLNALSMILIITVYVAMFVNIQRTRKATPRSLVMVGEMKIALRFFFIVFTDCACWLPIIVLKIVALKEVDISEKLIAWVVVFILPINSALNPFLYTFTTSTFRSKLMKSFRKDSSDTDVTVASYKKNGVCRNMSRDAGQPMLNHQPELAPTPSIVITKASLKNHNLLTDMNGCCGNKGNGKGKGDYVFPYSNSYVSTTLAGSLENQSFVNNGTVESSM